MKKLTKKLSILNAYIDFSISKVSNFRNKPEKEVLEKVSQEIMNNIVELQNNVDDKK